MLNRETAFRLINQTIGGYERVLSDAAFARRNNRPETLSRETLELAERHYEYTRAITQLAEREESLTSLTNEGVSELLGICRELSKAYSIGVRIPEGNLGIEFDAVHWFRTAIRENAKWRLEENMKEVPDLKGKLLDDVKNYPEDGRNFFEKLVGERPTLPEEGPLAELMEKQKEYDERARAIQIYRTEQVNLKVGRPSVTIHDAVEVQKQTTARIKELTGKIEELEAQQRKLQHEYPLVVMMQKNAWYDRETLEKEIEDAIEKIIAAQEKVYRKIMDGSFPVWQMTPVVMDVLGVEGLTDGDRQEIYGWLSEQQWKAEIRDVLLNVLPVALTIACFFIPGGASVSLLVLKRGVQAGLGIVNMYAAGEAFSRAFDMKNVVYAQSTRPDLRLTDAVISDADREVVMGFVNLLMAMVNIVDVVIASKLLGKFMSLGPELRKTLNGLGPKGVEIVNNLEVDKITSIHRLGSKGISILSDMEMEEIISISRMAKSDALFKKLTVDELKYINNLDDNGLRTINRLEDAEQVGRYIEIKQKPQAFEIGEDAKNHLQNAKRFDRSKGVVGGHEIEAFYNEIQKQGYLLEDCKFEIIEHPRIKGVYEITYYVPEKDLAGKVIKPVERLRTFDMPKTVYDGSKLNGEEVYEWGIEAFRNIEAIKGIEVKGRAQNGLLFFGYIDDETGIIKNFYPMLD